MVDIVGKDVFEKFSFDNKYDFFDFMWEFEIKKRKISFDLNEKVMIKVLVKLLEIFCKMNLGISIVDVCRRNLKCIE